MNPRGILLVALAAILLVFAFAQEPATRDPLGEIELNYIVDESRRFLDLELVNDVANYNPSDAAIETLILGEFKTLRGVVTEYVAKSAADREDARRVYTEQAAALDAPLATAQKALTDNAPLLKEIFDRVTIVFSEIRSAIEDDLLDNRTLLLRIAEHLKVRAERVLASVAIDRLRAGIARLELDRNFLTAFRDRLAQITTNDDVTDLELHAFAVDRVQAAIEKEREITRGDLIVTDYEARRDAAQTEYEARKSEITATDIKTAYETVSSFRARYEAAVDKYHVELRDRARSFLEQLVEITDESDTNRLRFAIKVVGDVPYASLEEYATRAARLLRAIALDISRVDPRLLVVRKRLPEEKFARDAARRSLSEITVDETFEVLIVDETKEDPIIEPVFDDAALTVEVEATIGEARERVASPDIDLNLAEIYSWRDFLHRKISTEFAAYDGSNVDDAIVAIQNQIDQMNTALSYARTQIATGIDAYKQIVSAARAIIETELAKIANSVTVYDRARALYKVYEMRLRDLYASLVAARVVTEFEAVMLRLKSLQRIKSHLEAYKADPSANLTVATDDVVGFEVDAQIRDEIVVRLKSREADTTVRASAALAEYNDFLDRLKLTLVGRTLLAIRSELATREGEIRERIRARLVDIVQDARSVIIEIIDLAEYNASEIRVRIHAVRDNAADAGETATVRETIRKFIRTLVVAEFGVSEDLVTVEDLASAKRADTVEGYDASISSGSTAPTSNNPSTSTPNPQSDSSSVVVGIVTIALSLLALVF